MYTGFCSIRRAPSRHPALLILSLAVALPSAAAAQIPARNMQIASHLDEYPVTGTTNYSACWSYVHSDGREYAAVGVGDGDGGGAFEGTAIYNVTNPAAPYRVGFIAGPPSIWREMKQYRSWIYVVTEGFGVGEGLQIIRMTDPEHPVLATTHTGAFHRSHTVAVDTTRGLLICNGTRVNAGGGNYGFSGMRVLSLANPEAPVELSHWPAFAPSSSAQADTYYVHDSVPIGNRLYAASVYKGFERVFDFSNPANPVQLAAWTYSGGFTHNSWPDKTGNWLYVTDEKNGEPLKIFDISNLSSPVLFNGFTPNPHAIVHNVHVKGDEIYVASYTEGVRVLDATDPGHPAEYAYADTWPGPSGDYNGVWEVAPFFPSGTVVASDRTSGLWVLRPQRDYGLVRMKVLDATNSQPLGDTPIFVDGDSLSTTADGVAVFALDPGSRTLIARRFGYDDATVVRNVSIGSRDTVVVSMVRKPAVSFSGAIQNAATLAPLAEAELDLDYTPLHDHTDAAGLFDLASVPVGFYRVVVRCPGFVPVAFERQIGPGNATMSFRLAAAPTYSSLETAPGWTVGSIADNATVDAAGKWVLADPIGTSAGSSMTSGDALEAAAFGQAPWRPGARPAHEGEREASGLSSGPIAPADDRSPTGTQCFVTGLGVAGAPIDAYDLDGITTLTSPTLDLTGKTIPAIGYWRWFYTNTGEPTDYLNVQLSNDNGFSWTTVETLQGRHNEWEEAAIHVSDYMSPSSQMRVRFIANDQGPTSLVEAAIDDLILYDAATLPVGSEVDPGRAPARLALRTPWPNPAAGAVRAVLELPQPGRVVTRILDLHGRQIATLLDGAVGAGTRVVTWNGLDTRGQRARAGVYFMVAHSRGASATARLVLLP